jgi:bacterioferritin-associated ferredoxin
MLRGERRMLMLGAAATMLGASLTMLGEAPRVRSEAATIPAGAPRMLGDAETMLSYASRTAGHSPRLLWSEERMLADADAMLRDVAAMRVGQASSWRDASQTGGGGRLQRPSSIFLPAGLPNEKLKAKFNFSELMYVCLCNGVTERDILEAIEAGASSVEEVGHCTGAGTRCGTCVRTLAAMVGGVEGVNPPLCTSGSGVIAAARLLRVA